MENKNVVLKNTLNMSTWLLVLLDVVTIGIYPLIWMWQKREAINKEVGAVLISDTFIIVMAIMTALNLICVVTDYGSYFGLAAGIGWIVFGFKARKILVAYALSELKIDLRMNGFYTFLFTLFYVVYCINNLPALSDRQSMLRAAQC